jgi:hypothetical protein
LLAAPVRRRYTVCLGQQLYDRLRAEAELNSRHLRAQVLYLLELMMAVANQVTGFRLKPEPQEQTVQNLGVKLEFLEELGDQIFHKAHSFGLNQQQFMRTLLWMGLDFTQRFGPPGQVQEKEELIRLVVEGLRPPPRIQ